jgi:hypothetical protein
VNLPVWAVFLVVGPVLALLMNGLTYLLFRYRWWRAGATI